MREPRPGYKFVICPAPGCQERRRHHEHPDEERGPQLIEVPDDWHPDQRPAWCSMSCAMMAGSMTASGPKPVFWKRFLEKYVRLNAHFHSENGDLLLEVKTSPVAEDWYYAHRPANLDSEKVRNGMCWEIMSEMSRNAVNGWSPSGQEET